MKQKVSKTYEPIELFLLELYKKKISKRNDYFSMQREFAKKYKISFFNKDKLVSSYHKLIELKIIKPEERLEDLIKLKETRSLSGIVVVSVFTKPYDCPGNCIYCPLQKGLPKSYLDKEPAAMRAMMCNFDPYIQVKARLLALKSTGHPLDKINIRIIGGTWSYYTKHYQTWFVKKLFQACNDFSKKSEKTERLEKLQKTNETSRNRIVEISIETRQDFISKDEIKRLRMLGVTKVELGIQSIYDDVLRVNKRGHDLQKSINATRLLKDAGFKVSYQVMANLPGSNVKRDKKMFCEIFDNDDFKPDYIKIYPLALVKEAPIYELYKKNKFKPYNKKQLVDVLKAAKSSIPFYTRVERVIRDIPADYIVEGASKISNLRQIVLNELKQENKKCKCIRCREIKNEFDAKDKIKMFRYDYEASNGKEIFLSFEKGDRKKLIGFLRLRIPSNIFAKKNHFLPVLNNVSIIREIHTYGPQLPIGQYSNNAAQHQGFGKKLIAEAEKITKEEFGLNKIAVISGVGVREYFKKLDYKLVNSYMVKNL